MARRAQTDAQSTVFDDAMTPSGAVNCGVGGDGENAKGRCPEFLGISGIDSRGRAMVFSIVGLT